MDIAHLSTLNYNVSHQVSFEGLPEVRTPTRDAWGFLEKQICFGKLSECITPDTPYLNIFIQDQFTLLNPKTSHAKQYLAGIERVLLPLIKPLYYEYKSRGTDKYIHLLIDSREVHGSVLLGVLNALKAVCENPSMMMSYLYIKEHYKDLRFYQRYVAAHKIILPCGYYQGFSGQHKTISPPHVKSIKDLSLKKVRETWKTFRDPQNSYFQTNKFIPGTGHTMNGYWLPDPWGSSPLGGDKHPAMPLRDEAIQWLLEPADKKTMRFDVEGQKWRKI